MKREDVPQGAGPRLLASFDDDDFTLLDGVEDLPGVSARLLELGSGHLVACAHLVEEALDYFRPLIEGEPKLVFEGGRPATLVPFNKR